MHIFLKCSKIKSHIFLLWKDVCRLLKKLWTLQNVKFLYIHCDPDNVCTIGHYVITDHFIPCKYIYICMNYLFWATNFWILCITGAVHPGHAAPLRVQSPWDDPLGPRNLWGPQAPRQPRCGRAGQNLGPWSSTTVPRQVKIQIPFSSTVCNFQCCFFIHVHVVVLTWSISGSICANDLFARTIYMDNTLIYVNCEWCFNFCWL